MLFMSGCSSTLKTRPTDAQGLFPTSSLLDVDGIMVDKPFSSKYKAIAYVQMDNSKSVEYKDFFIDSIKNLHIFNQVLGKSDIESLVIQRGLAGKVESVSDLVGLNRLAKQVGPFLIVKPYME